MVTALAAVAVVAACASGSPASEPDRDPSDPAGTAETVENVSGTVTIYAAASLQAAFTDLIAEFEARHPAVTVEPPVYDGSSTLVTQLTEGAQADVFASADEATMGDLVTAGLADGDPRLFASNTLVIAVAPGNPLGISDLDDLADVSYAVCAPEVPCGAATMLLFDRAAVELDPITQEQNVTAVAERVAGGEVDAGLVYATDVASRGDALIAVVPSNADQVVNRYPITTIVGADPAADAFVEFVLSDAGQAVLAEHGFGPP